MAAPNIEILLIIKQLQSVDLLELPIATLYYTSMCGAECKNAW